jgi:hypothetical protein
MDSAQVEIQHPFVNPGAVACGLCDVQISSPIAFGLSQALEISAGTNLEGLVRCSKPSSQ